MSVLGAMVRGSVENPDTPLSPSTIAEWFGGGPVKSGARVTETRVLGLPTFFTGVRLVSSSLAQIPMHVYKSNTRTKLDKAIWAPALEWPNPAQTPFEFWQTFFLHAQCWGNGFAFKVRGASGKVVELWLIHPSRVSVHHDPNPMNPTRKRFLVVFEDGLQAWYTPADIFHLPYLSIDGREGIRPLQVLREALGKSIAVDDAAALFYGQGTMISGVLTTDASLSDTQATALKRRWQEKVAGPANHHKIAVLDNGAKFAQVGISPADAQLLESRKWEVAELARIIGLPPHMVGDVSGSTSWGSGIEQMSLGVIVYLFAGWIAATEQRQTADLIAGGRGSSAYVKGSVQAFLRGDAKTRSAFYQRGIADGWLNRNEAREFEEQERVDGLDYGWRLLRSALLLHDPERLGPDGRCRLPCGHAWGGACLLPGSAVLPGGVCLRGGIGGIDRLRQAEVAD